MQNVRYVRMFFNSLATILAAADAVLERTGTAAEEERYIREFSQAIGGRKNFSEDTVRLYETEGKSYRSALNVLRRENVPCVAYTMKGSNVTLIAVPQAYREQADRIINNLNRTQIKNEQTRAEFMRSHIGEECSRFGGIDKAMQRIIRDGMAKETIEYAFETTKPGELTLYCASRDADIVSRIVFEARAAVLGKYAGEREYVAAKQDLAIRDVGLSLQSGGERIIYIHDASEKSGEMYVIENGKLSKVRKDGSKKHIADEVLNPDKFKAHITAVIRDMTIPLVAAKTREELKMIGDAPSAEKIFSGGRLEEARKEHEKTLPKDTRIAEAQKYALEIAHAVLIDGKTRLESVDELSQISSLSDLADRAAALPDQQKAIEQLKGLSLSDKESKEVIDYVMVCCTAQIEADPGDIEITADMLDFRDMSKWIGYQTELVLDTSGREPHPDISDSIDGSTRIEGAAE